MKKYMVGAIFDMEYLQKLEELNHKYPGNRVNEIYGSMGHAVLPTARPDHRLKPLSYEWFETYVREAVSKGFIFNYTMNSPHIGDLENISKHWDDWADRVLWLQSIGVGRVTIAHPLLLSLVCEYTDIPIELSTIMELRDFNKIRQLKGQYPNINKVCVAIEINRNINELTILREQCRRIGVEVEVLVSEFCKTGHSNCIHRKHCYDLHAANQTKEVARRGINSDGSHQPKSIIGYPWNGKTGCIYSRAEPISWLISNTIWPQYMDRYEEMTDVNHYKISSRTAPPEYGLWLAEAYMSQHFEGPLANLWLQLQASDSYVNDPDKFWKLQQQGIPKYTIDSLLKRRKFDGYSSMAFFDIFFEMPDMDWSTIDWVEFTWAELWLKEIS